MRDWTERFNTYAETIGNYLTDRCLLAGDEPQKILFESMRYSLLAGGKRLRPCYVFEFCRLCGGDWALAAPFAAAVEMIHTYSLIHDDLPCMDNDDYRRGKLTNHKVYGETMAVLAGDALQPAAFAQITQSSFPDDVKVKAVTVLARCAGERGMVGGQVLDILSEERECTKQEVLDIQSRKTGALFRAACILGVLAGGGSEEQIRAAGEYADHVGLAFQLRDDVLDVIGSSEELGKAVGVDGDKNTFVRLYGLETCMDMIERETNLAIQSLSEFNAPDALIWLTRSLTTRKK